MTYLALLVIVLHTLVVSLQMYSYIIVVLHMDRCYGSGSRLGPHFSNNLENRFRSDPKTRSSEETYIRGLQQVCAVINNDEFDPFKV
jgi:hypothetical protein